MYMTEPAETIILSIVQCLIAPIQLCISVGILCYYSLLPESIKCRLSKSVLFLFPNMCTVIYNSSVNNDNDDNNNNKNKNNKLKTKSGTTYQNILITGATSGLGKELAFQYSADIPNVNLYLTGRNKHRLRKTMLECSALVSFFV